MTANKLIECAKKYLGKPYVWGGESDTEGGYDCSGFVYRALNDAGYSVARLTAYCYSKIGKEITKGMQKEGDLLFFGRPVSHVAIYLGNGKMIESRGNKSNTKSNPGTGVVISEVSRRSDLTQVRRVCKEIDINSNTYRVGTVYTTKVDKLRVRNAVWGNVKTYSQLTADAQKHAYSTGSLKKGTNVTCKNITCATDGSTWLQIPSGWICAINSNGEVYVS